MNPSAAPCTLLPGIPLGGTLLGSGFVFKGHRPIAHAHLVETLRDQRVCRNLAALTLVLVALLGGPVMLAVRVVRHSRPHHLFLVSLR